jgi:hypothetical protein
MDILGPEPGDKAQPWANLHVVQGAPYDYGSHGQQPCSLGRSASTSSLLGPHHLNLQADQQAYKRYGVPPRFRIGDPIRSLPEWGLMDAGETPKI